MPKEIIKRVIKIFILLLLCSNSFIYAATNESGSPVNSKRDQLYNFFDSDDPYEEVGTAQSEGTIKGDGKCEVRCRLLNTDYTDKETGKNYDLTESYVVKIVDFDATTGVTSCDVFPKYQLASSERAKFSIMANRKDVDCLNEYKSKKAKEDELVSTNDYQSDNASLVSIDKDSSGGTAYDRKKLTLTKFMAGLATFDLDVLDLKNTIGTGTVVRTDGQEIYSIANPKDENGNQTDTITSRVYNAIDRISRENLGYYVDLKYSLNKLEQYVLTIMFVLLATFFMVIYFSKFIIKKIAKKPTTYDESWAQRLVMIVFVTAIFFIPIKIDDNYSSTLFQNIWTAAVDESTSIADRANITCMAALMRNTYNTAGANGVQSEKNLNELKNKQGYLVDTYYKLLHDECQERFPQEMTFQETNPFAIAQIELQNGHKTSDFGYRGCREVEAKYKVAKTSFEQYSYMLDRIKQAYGGASDSKGSQITDRLKEIDSFMGEKVQEIGWYSAALAPTLKLQVQQVYLQSNDAVKPPISVSEEAKVNEADSTEIAKREMKLTGGNSLVNQFNSNVDFQKSSGKLFGYFPLGMLPGYGSIKSFVDDLGDTDVNTFLDNIPKNDEASKLDKEVNDPKLNKSKLTMFVQQNILDVFPMVTAFLLVALGIIMYLYELIVFTYISPFVVTYAVATGSASKVIQFLVRGIVVFILPLMIVISTYFAMFLYGVFNDIFMTLVSEQFYLSLLSSGTFASEYIFTLIKVACATLGSIIAMIILWRVISGMPNMILKMIGFEKGTASSEISGAIQQSLSRFGFKM